MKILPHSLFEPNLMTKSQKPQQLSLFTLVDISNNPPPKETKSKKHNPPINTRTDYEDGLIGG